MFQVYESIFVYIVKVFILLTMNYFITHKRAKAHCRVHSRTFHRAEEAKRYNPRVFPLCP